MKEIIDNSSFSLRYLHHFNRMFPVQSIKVIDDSHIVVTYRLNKDGTDVYAYVVFEKIVNYYEISDSIEEAGYYENWICYGEYYFAEKTIPYSQYAYLKAGNILSADDIKTLAIYYDEIPTLAVSYGKGTFGTEELCLMKEGVLKITLEYEISFSEESSNAYFTVPNITVSNFIVSRVEFYPYGEKSDASEGISIVGEGRKIELPQ